MRRSLRRPQGCAHRPRRAAGRQCEWSRSRPAVRRKRIRSGANPCGDYKDAGAAPAAKSGLFAVEFLLELAALLRLDRQRRGGPREQALDADRLARLLAIPVPAVFDAGEGRVDFLQQLALAIARAQLQRVLLLQRRAIGRVRRERELAKVLGGRSRILAQLALQLEEAFAEEPQLRGVHVLRLRHLRDFRLGQGFCFAGHRSSLRLRVGWAPAKQGLSATKSR